MINRPVQVLVNYFGPVAADHNITIGLQYDVQLHRELTCAYIDMTIEPMP